MNENSNIETVTKLFEMGRAAGVPVVVNGSEPFLVVPKDFKAESIAQFLPPARIKRSVTLLEPGSFGDYVNRFKSDDSLIFAEVTDSGARFVALLDYHSKAPELTPHYCAHMASFECSPTKEWTDWMAANGRRMDQVAFATFLEENLKMITNPPGAELLELVTNLHGHSDARFNSALRLQSGAVKIGFDEDVVLRGTSQTKAGEVELPTEITAGIAPFEGVDAYEVRARLKFKIENRKLMLWFETIAPHRIVRDAIVGITKTIAEGTEIIPLIGKP